MRTLVNVTVRLVQMSHCQKSKPKGNTVLKSLEITCTQMRVCLQANGILLPANWRC